MTALALALQENKLEAAQRLMQLGANPLTPVGAESMPVALLPVTEGKVEAIRVLRRAGVDYSKIRFRNATAFDFARQLGDEELLKALGQEKLGL